MADLIDRQAAIELCDWYDNPSLHDDLEKLPPVQPDHVADISKKVEGDCISRQMAIDAAYEQGRIAGRVEMRTEILTELKKIVGSEVWNNI